MVEDSVARMGFWAAASFAIPLFCLGCGSGSNANPLGVHPLPGLGGPCNLSVDAGPSQAVHNASASECPSHLCLRTVVQQGSAGPNDTAPFCTAECNQDSDCDGELRDPTNPLDKRCRNGFTCGVAMVVGPLGCQNLCLCKDFLGPSGAPTPIACQAGTGGGAPISSASGVGQQTDLYVSVAPSRLLDLVFMIDNSPSMAPKVTKLSAQFPKLIAALKDSNDGTLPDLRVAIIDSDLGTNGGWTSPSGCGPKTLADGTASSFGDLGRFQMISTATNTCTFNAGDLYLEYKAGAPMNYTGDINTVFACLASNLGTLGCGEEHQLQAFEFALAAKQIGNEKQQEMLRPNAYLGLVFLTDEDDCSAATNDGLFGDKPELRGESASLRCATRAHRCGGQNLNNSGPNYPTTAAFTHPFNDCQARIGDECGDRDTSVPTDCNPLKNVATLANEMKALKNDPDNQILVAGIFGWPLTDADMASAQYKIAPVPNPNTADSAHPTLYDYWPVCYDPGHMPSASTTDATTGFDSAAAGWSATGGLRESAFIDEFGANGLKFSICQPDFSQSMKVIGDSVARKLQNLCVDYKLLDGDLTTPGLQPTCRVVWRTPALDPKDPTRVIYTESAASLPPCPAGATSGNVATDCWQLIYDPTKCPVNGQLLSVLRTAQEMANNPQLAAGTKIGMQCLTCPNGTANLDPSSDTYQACNY